MFNKFFFSYRDVVRVGRILELEGSMQIIDQVKPADVDPADPEGVDFSGDDRNEVDGVKTERNYQWSVAEA